MEKWSGGGAQLFLLARATSALLGVATVWMVFLAGRELFRCRSAGLLAALLLAVAFLHVRNSHFGTNDVAATFLAVAAFWQISRMYNGAGWTSLLWTGVFVGLAIGFKYNAALMVVPLVVALLLRDGEGGRRRWKFAAVGLVAVLLVAAVAFIVSNPQVVTAWHKYRQGLRSLSSQAMAGSHFGQEQSPPPLLLLKWIPLSIGWLQALFLPIAVFALARVQPRRLLLVLSLPLAVVASSFRVEYFMLRFLVPMLPFVALVVAAGVLEVVRRLPLRESKALATVLVLVPLIAGPAASSVRFGSVQRQADTRQQARDWVATHLPEGAAIYSDGFGPKGRSDGASQIGGIDYRRVRFGISSDLQRFLDGGVRYYIVTSWIGGRIGVYPEETSFFVRRRFLRDLRELGTTLARFSPYRPGVEEPFHLSELHAPVRPFSRLRPGPIIEILEVRPQEGLTLPPSYRIEGFSEGDGVLRLDGKKYLLGRRVQGEIETERKKRSRRLGRDDLVLQGWALGPENRTFDAVLVFQGDRFLGAIEYGGNRKDINRRLGIRAGRVGFRARLGSSPGITIGQLRVLALSGDAGTVFEIPTP